ncbi:MAG: DEAD/DEAH box helicase [Fibrobacteria bacterium]|nr:DEAD/DEAH box helicase [Fibrobacteria bacterium]
MAKILPSHPLGPASAAYRRAHRLVSALPEGYVAWSPVVRTGNGLPDFWIVEEASRRSVVVLVSEAGDDQLQGPGLFESGIPWTDPVEEITGRVKSAREALQVRSMRGAALFPMASRGNLPPRVDGWPCAGRETTRPTVFEAWVASLLGDPLDPEVLQSVRARFSPETLVRPNQVMRREPGSEEVPRFLTWRQEEILKHGLEAGAEGAEAVGAFELLLVQGVAGSGKSLVLLHRAVLLKQLDPKRRVLVLTCNKPLQMELRRRLRELGDETESVEVSTFHAFCLRRWPHSRRPTILEAADRRILVDEVRGDLERPTLLRRQVEDELAWIFDHGFPDEETYAEHPRRGRGFRMDADLRTRFWGAATRYRALCEERGEADWSLVPLLFKEALQEHEPRPYDAILVDEAQFFAPVWFDCLRRFLTPRGHLFLAADPSQGFLRSGTSWKSAGLAVQGRTRRLERSHRSTGPIMSTAWAVWKARNKAPSSEPEEETVEPRLDGMSDGPVPLLYHFPDARAEHQWIVDQVERFLEDGGRAEDVLVLHQEWGGARSLLEKLRERLGFERAREARENDEGRSQVRVCALAVATGLESPVVFVGGTQGIFEREGSPDLDADGRNQARDEATRRFHMALTRAGWRLVLTATGPLPEEVEKVFGT